MNVSQDYPHMSEWPAELGPVPTEDQVIQAYAVLVPLSHKPESVGRM